MCEFGKCIELVVWENDLSKNGFLGINFQQTGI